MHLSEILTFTPFQSPLLFNQTLTGTSNKTQFRNLNNPDFLLPPYYNKSFMWNRNYAIKYDLTRTLKTEFKVRNTASIDEPGELDRSDPLFILKKEILFGIIF